MENIQLNFAVTSNMTGFISQVNAATAAVEKFNVANKSGAINDGLMQAQQNFNNAMKSSGAFHHQMVQIRTEADKLGGALSARKLGLGESLSAIRGMNKEYSAMTQLAEKNIKAQQSIVTGLRRDSSGKLMADIWTPDQIQNVNGMSKAAQISREKMKILHETVRQGSDAMINLGKNTQWAGRQMMVGLSLPIGIAVGAATKAFIDMDKELVRIQKVYGAGLNQNAEDFKKQGEVIRADAMKTAQDLASAWGQSSETTLKLEGDLAAVGKTGKDLQDSVKQMSRLSILGEIDPNAAMKAGLALQTAFKQNNAELTKSIDFMNAVENQTSTSMNDLVEAIPRAGATIHNLGGNIQDLSLYMTALREGGVSAGEGANALKSGLASIMSPADGVAKKLKTLGVDIKGIVQQGGGDLTKTLMLVGKEMEKLNPVEKTQAMVTLFGKFQFNKMAALLNNLGKEGSQTLKVLDLIGKSPAELAKNSEVEMNAVTESASGKWNRMMASLKTSMATLGKDFAGPITTIVGWITGLIDKFNKLDDTVKKFIEWGAIIAALVGPIVMVAGVFMNFIGTIVKGGAAMAAFFSGKGKGRWTEFSAEMSGAKAITEGLIAPMQSVASATDTFAAAIQRLSSELQTLKATGGATAAMTRAEAIQQVGAKHTGVIVGTSKHNADKKGDYTESELAALPQNQQKGLLATALLNNEFEGREGSTAQSVGRNQYALHEINPDGSMGAVSSKYTSTAARNLITDQRAAYDRLSKTEKGTEEYKIAKKNVDDANRAIQEFAKGVLKETHEGVRIMSETNDAFAASGAAARQRFIELTDKQGLAKENPGLKNQRRLTSGIGQQVAWGNAFDAGKTRELLQDEKNQLPPGSRTYLSDSDRLALEHISADERLTAQEVEKLMGIVEEEVAVEEQILAAEKEINETTEKISNTTTQREKLQKEIADMEAKSKSAAEKALAAAQGQAGSAWRGDAKTTAQAMGYQKQHVALIEKMDADDRKYLAASENATVYQQRLAELIEKRARSAKISLDSSDTIIKKQEREAQLEAELVALDEKNVSAKSRQVKLSQQAADLQAKEAEVLAAGVGIQERNNAVNAAGGAAGGRTGFLGKTKGFLGGLGTTRMGGAGLGGLGMAAMMLPAQEGTGPVATGINMASQAGVGAMIGSMIAPGVGTAIGAVAGGAYGLIEKLGEASGEAAKKLTEMSDKITAANAKISTSLITALGGKPDGKTALDISPSMYVPGVSNAGVARVKELDPDRVKAMTDMSRDQSIVAAQNVYNQLVRSNVPEKAAKEFVANLMAASNHVGAVSELNVRLSKAAADSSGASIAKQITDAMSAHKPALDQWAMDTNQTGKFWDKRDYLSDGELSAETRKILENSGNQMGDALADGLLMSLKKDKGFSKKFAAEFSKGSLGAITKQTLALGRGDVPKLFKNQVNESGVVNKTRTKYRPDASTPEMRGEYNPLYQMGYREGDKVSTQGLTSRYLSQTNAQRGGILKGASNEFKEFAKTAEASGDVIAKSMVNALDEKSRGAVEKLTDSMMQGKNGLTKYQATVLALAQTQRGTMSASIQKFASDMLQPGYNAQEAANKIAGATPEIQQAFYAAQASVSNFKGRLEEAKAAGKNVGINIDKTSILLARAAAMGLTFDLNNIPKDLEIIINMRYIATHSGFGFGAEIPSTSDNAGSAIASIGNAIGALTPQDSGGGDSGAGGDSGGGGGGGGADNAAQDAANALQKQQEEELKNMQKLAQERQKMREEEIKNVTEFYDKQLIAMEKTEEARKKAFEAEQKRQDREKSWHSLQLDMAQAVAKGDTFGILKAGMDMKATQKGWLTEDKNTAAEDAYTRKHDALLAKKDAQIAKLTKENERLSAQDQAAYDAKQEANQAALDALQGHASGGYISGPGTSRSDSIRTRLSNGEYVVNASAVSSYGRSMLDSINEQRFATGGAVGKDAKAPSAPKSGKTSNAPAGKGGAASKNPLVAGDKAADKSMDALVASRKAALDQILADETATAAAIVALDQQTIATRQAAYTTYTAVITAALAGWQTANQNTATVITNSATQAMSTVTGAVNNAMNSAKAAFAAWGTASSQVAPELAKTITNSFGAINFEQLIKMVDSYASGDVAAGNEAKGALGAGVGAATGGYITGPGSGTSDSIPARLSNGEYVIKNASVQRYGTGFLSKVNNGEISPLATQNFADGGLVGALGQVESKNATAKLNKVINNAIVKKRKQLESLNISGNPDKAGWDDNLAGADGKSLPTTDGVYKQGGLLYGVGAEEILKRAARAIGTPYSQANRTGGPGNGFDCSSFVSWVYKPWHALNEEQGSTASLINEGVDAGGTRIAGDILLHNPSSTGATGSGHAALYIGNGMVQESGNPNSFGSEGGRFEFARRILGNPYAKAGPKPTPPWPRYVSSAVNYSGVPVSSIHGIGVGNLSKLNYREFAKLNPNAAAGTEGNALAGGKAGVMDASPWTGGPMPGIDGNVLRWGNLVAGILKEFNVDQKYVYGVLRQMQQESSGDPNSINLWDSNARAGYPSKGLMQVIAPTYQSNAKPGYEDLNYQTVPYYNVWAAIHYVLTHEGYGIQKLESWNNGSNMAYANGGYVSGPGSSRSDSIPARLSNGEYVIQQSAVSRYGTSFLDKVNNGQLGLGGFRSGISNLVNADVAKLFQGVADVANAKKWIKIAAAEVKNPATPAPNATGTPTSGNATMDAYAAQMESFVGQSSIWGSSVAGHCLKNVNDIWEHMGGVVNRHPAAVDAGAAVAAAGQLKQGDAPRGALLWWNGGVGSGYGHVAIADGRGNFVNNWSGGVIEVNPMSAAPNGYIGWSYPDTQRFRDGGLVIPALRKGATINYDNTLANLHAGEAVLTAPLTQKLNKGIDDLASGSSVAYNVSVNIDKANATPYEIEQAVYSALNKKEIRSGRSRVIGGGR